MRVSHASQGDLREMSLRDCGCILWKVVAKEQEAP